MSEYLFDHEKLDVYRLALEFLAWVSRELAQVKGQRSVLDHLQRAAQSIILNIAEGNGKRSLQDRKRFFEIARGSTFESAASLDILVVLGAISKKRAYAGKRPLHRVAAMLSRMTEKNARLAT